MENFETSIVKEFGEDYAEKVGEYMK